MALTKSDLEESFIDQVASTTEDQRDIIRKAQNSVKELALQTKSTKMMAENNAQFESNAIASGYNQKSAEAEAAFKAQYLNNQRSNMAELNLQRDELKNTLAVQTDKHKHLEDEQVRVQKAELSTLDKLQHGLMKERQDDFKIRYDKMAAEHDSILKELTKHFHEDVKKVTESSSSEKKILEKKVEDQFYRIEKLNPKITDGLKEITVSLPIAEYEKENVHLSTQGRTVKITLSRKFADNLTSPEGGIDRSTRSELYSKEIIAPDILSPKNILQHYEDGILSFKIKKA